MKRGGWIRRDLDKAREWLERKSPIKKRNTKRAKKAREDAFGPPGFVEFVQARECVVARTTGFSGDCIGPNQHCHRKSRGAGGGWRDNSFCACLGHHRQEHDYGRDSWEALHGLDLDLECLATTAQWDKAEHGW